MAVATNHLCVEIRTTGGLPDRRDYGFYVYLGNPDRSGRLHREAGLLSIGNGGVEWTAPTEAEGPEEPPVSVFRRAGTTLRVAVKIAPYKQRGIYGVSFRDFGFQVTSSFTPQLPAFNRGDCAPDGRRWVSYPSGALSPQPRTERGYTRRGCLESQSGK